MPDQHEEPNLEQLIAMLGDDTARTPQEVFRRCQALEQLSAMGPAAIDALPVIMQSLLVRVSVDCVLALRVAAAEAVWKVGQRRDLALPFLTWALKDEYWGVSQKAIKILTEMGTSAHGAVPDLANLGERRLDHGPFSFEKNSIEENRQSVLSLLARALGECGRGVQHVETVRGTLNRIADCDDANARVAARRALKNLTV